mmetsp:Transcript_20924/g.52559  ORF Transcript_20924/g.52559 Transcript_20924/m.52559 type:complete len:705 (-) Transcript_20924:302-2416(-)
MASVPADELEDSLLLCIICTERFQDPRRIGGCGHTYCLKCVQKLWDSSNEDLRDRRSIKCPACREVHPLPREGGVASLPKNTDLVNLSDHIESGRKRKREEDEKRKREEDEESQRKMGPLFEAARGGGLEDLKTCLQLLGTEVRDGKSKQTALHVAAEHGKVECVRLLLGREARTDARDRYGHTPLHFAAQGFPDCVRLLLDKQADVRARDNFGATPLHCAAGRCDVKSVRQLLAEEADVMAKNKNGETPLHLAVMMRGTNYFQISLLGEAANRSCVECVKELLAKGADVNAKLDDGWTPLHFAASEKYSCPGCLELLLLEKADVNAETKKSGTPLHLSVRLGSKQGLACMAKLLENGANVNAKMNGEAGEEAGWTPLHLAVFLHRTEFVQELLKHQADVNAKSEDGLSPLHLAAQNNTVGVLLLASQGSTPLNVMAATNLGYTPLHYAAQEGYVTALQTLLEKQADKSAKAKDGATPLHLAAKFGKSQCVMVLLMQKALVDAKAEDGCTPLHLAAQEGEAACVKMLLLTQADSNAERNDGATPLHLAAKCGRSQCLKLLLLMDANVNAKDKFDGETALHLAASSGSLECTQDLLVKGADVFAKNNEGLKPLECTGCERIAQMLERQETYYEESEGDWEREGDEEVRAAPARRRLPFTPPLPVETSRRPPVGGSRDRSNGSPMLDELLEELQGEYDDDVEVSGR